MKTGWSENGINSRSCYSLHTLEHRKKHILLSTRTVHAHFCTTNNTLFFLSWYRDFTPDSWKSMQMMFIDRGLQSSIPIWNIMKPCLNIVNLLKWFLVYWMKSSYKYTELSISILSKINDHKCTQPFIACMVICYYLVWLCERDFYKHLTQQGTR